jgi:hypothetical protein
LAIEQKVATSYIAEFAGSQLECTAAKPIKGKSPTREAEALPLGMRQGLKAKE